MTDSVVNLGQVFTPPWVVKKMLAMVKNKGSYLEPSVGTGAFWEEIESKNKLGVELNQSICPSNCLNVDFFAFSAMAKFDTIIGNPPYVSYKHILEETREKFGEALSSRYDKRTNLYVFFIDKCLDHLNAHGELIFITPRDFLKATSCKRLNEKIWKHGTITYYEELGDKTVFKGYSPNCVIWRYEKNNFSRKTTIDNKELNFKLVDGQINFVDAAKSFDVPFRDYFFVRVGAVSGMDEIYRNDIHASSDFVFSKTNATGKTKKYIYCDDGAFDSLQTVLYLCTHKDTLMSRKIKNFNNSNWHQWGRDYHKSNSKRVYVNCKTRAEKPFFTHECRAYDGSILAIFLKEENELSVRDAASMLNEIDWREYGFVCDGRYIFSQRSLENIYLDKTITDKYGLTANDSI